MRILLLIALLLAGCANHAPPAATGPWHRLNAAYWGISPNKLVDVPPLPGE